MHVKLDLESERVKGLCFHPTRSWILTSLHTGEIIIYDWEAGAVFQRYSPEAATPIRAVNFHATRPLFVTGSDDGIVRVYNYEHERCIFSFNDHLDFIRTVQFHPTQPFIVSASDDQTIRIFNWETRKSLSILSGHNHYVMSAFFHPTRPLILSSSLDDSVRVWDVSALFRDNGQGRGGLFALTDVVLKFQQEEHSYGVNWASWNSDRMLAVSCSDDQSVKVWKMTESELSVIATLLAHSDNVSCAIYHPTVDVMISASEDKSVRVWDSKRFISIGRYTRPDDRFWIVAAHPKLPLVAAGHDTGLVMFRLLRMRPTYEAHGAIVLYYRENSIRSYNAEAQNDTIVGQTKPRYTGNRTSPLDPPPRSFCFSQSHNKLLVGHDDKFELHGLGGSGPSEQQVESGVQPIWISRNQFAWLSGTGPSFTQLYVKEANGVSITKVTIPASQKIFAAGTGMVFLVAAEQVMLFDVMRHQVVAEKALPAIRRAFVSNDKKKVAFLGRTTVTIAPIDLGSCYTFQDGAKVTSGAWHDGFFIYSTVTHIKYLLPNGDNGIIRSISERLFIALVRERLVVCLNYDSEITQIEADFTECTFKMALVEGNMGKVASILKYAKLCSESIIDYLEKQGHPEVALKFVEDLPTKFRLAIAAGDLMTAVGAAVKIDDAATWDTLVDEAISHGRFSVAEVGLKKSGNVEKLAFFYLISGQHDQLRTMKLDESLSLQRAIWLNDRGAMSGLLKDAAPCLSYVAAKTSGHDEFADGLGIEDEMKAALDQRVGSADMNGVSGVTDCGGDWPLLFVSQPQFDVDNANDEAVVCDDLSDGAWGSDSDGAGAGAADEGLDGDVGEDGWDVGIEIDEGPITPGVFVAPAFGKSEHERWVENTRVPGEIVAAGFFGQALTELQAQIGLVNPEPLKQHFVHAYAAATASVQVVANCPAVMIPISIEHGSGRAPVAGLSIAGLKAAVSVGYAKTRAAKFDEALSIFRGLVQSIPVMVCSTKAEEKEVLDIIRICRHYIIGLAMELEIKSTTNSSRKVELAAYFTHCELQPAHVVLTLKSGMSIARKNGFNGLAAAMARRLANMTRSEEDARRAQALEGAKKREGKPDPTINYDERNPFDVCCGSMSPIYRGLPKVVCPFCGSCYKPEFRDSRCKVCELCSVGAEVPGLSIVRSRRS